MSAQQSFLSRIQPPGFDLITVDDWFTMPEAPDRYELNDGMLVLAPSPDVQHQDIASVVLHSLMSVGLAEDGFAMPSRTGLALSKDTGYEPDVLYLSKARMGLFTRRGVESAADVVVEVLSPRTRRYDLGTKLPKYLAHGVTEVWIIDPEAQTVSVHRSGEEPATVAFGEHIPSHVVDVGSALLERLPPLPKD